MSLPIHSILNDIKAFVFDVDGVMTDGTLLITEEGKLLRTFHIRDGYALRRAIQAGYSMAVVSGGQSEGVIKRLKQLGLTDIYMDAQEKESVLLDWMKWRGIHSNNLAYMGDDVLDVSAMKHAALKACPADAVQEILSIANYISPVKGGQACVRDLIELVLKVQNQW